MLRNNGSDISLVSVYKIVRFKNKDVKRPIAFYKIFFFFLFVNFMRNKKKRFDVSWANSLQCLHSTCY